MSYKKEIYLSWDELQSLSIRLAKMLLRTNKKFDAIVAVTRGGLFPAGLLARELNVHYIDTICVTTYNGKEGKKSGEARVLKLPLSLQNKSILVVDDLADKGTTLEAVKAQLPNACFATLFVKPLGKPRVDYFVEETDQETWIRFPWDTIRAYKNPLVE